MILIIYFDDWYLKEELKKNLVKRLTKHGIKFACVYYFDLEIFLSENKEKMDLIFLCGSAKRILRDGDKFPLIDVLMKKKIRIVGTCFGFQLLAHKSGGKIEEGRLVNGIRQIEFDGDKDGVYFNYHDRIKDLPKKWTVISRSADTINIATTNKWIGYLFHPENTDKDFDKYLLPAFKAAVS
jgi:GMP synthase-like glutamine amidotransferase